MQAGELRHRITFQRLKGVQDSFGQETEEWVDACSVWANINPLAGRAFFEAERNNSEVTHKVRMRFMRDISPKMRIIYQGRIFEIDSIINEYERNKVLLLMCKELV